MGKQAHTHLNAQRKPLTDSEWERPAEGLFATQIRDASADTTTSAPHESTTSDGHDFGQIAVQPVQAEAAPAPQMKLHVSQPGDAHEREADQVAEQVMRAPDTDVAAPESERTTPTPASTSGAQAMVPGGQGQPLDTATRAYMEPRFGHDFSQVRVHNDEQAAEAASTVSARAYTVGGDIVFGAQEYAPDTASGRRLLAHELTHVVQQSAGQVAGTVQREPVDAPEEVPEAVPGAATSGTAMPAAEMTDEELARAIMDKQLAVLAGWQGALANFDKVLTSASDKEAKPEFAKVVKDFLGELVMGELIKHSKPPTSEAFALLGKLDAEVKRAEAADASAAVRDFFVEHEKAITNLVQSTLALKEDFVARVRKTREAMEQAENVAFAAQKGKKGHASVTIASTKAADDYGMLRMNLIDTNAEMDARLKTSTTEQLFLKLSEEWMRYATVKGAWGIKYQAVVVIRLNPDYSIKDAHIQGTGGQKIAEQLLKDNSEGVNVFNLEVPRRVLLLAENGWPSAILSLDENDRNISSGTIAEGNYDALYRKLMAEGLPPTKKLDGD